MTTATFTAIYRDYANADAAKFIATLPNPENATVTTTMNEADADGFVNWTATVTYA